MKYKSESKFLNNLPKNFTAPSDFVARRLFTEYGSVFVAGGNVIPPDFVIFRDEDEVENWQNQISQATETIGGIEITLQTKAMESLKKAVFEVELNNLSITPRGLDAAKRNYSGTVQLWESRVNPALIHWVNQGRVSETDADKIRHMSSFEQVSEILKLESSGIFFSKNLSKSIIYSVAPPGTSQHISMLALDVCEHDNSKVREILAKHGWFQTVVSDLPHFTFLGVAENQLSDLGLKKVKDGGRVFWIPNI